MSANVRKLFHDDHGTTAVEYGLIAAFIVLAVATALPSLGVSVQGLFQSVLDAFGH